jgi:hypothetical protein
MSYAPGAAREGFVADPRRVLLGTVLSPIVPSAAAAIPQFSLPSFWAVVTLGLLSVLTLYLPLVLWRLPHTRHPFWTCVLLGGLSAPGLFGYSLAIILGIAAGAPAAPLLVLLFTFPLGALGGVVFWLCVVWRSDDRAN